MESIKVEYFIKKENDEEYLYMKTIDEKWAGTEGSYIFMESGEGILKSSYSNICFDLSQLKFISSSYLGVIMNLVSLAKEPNKWIKFRVGKECMETFQLVSVDKVTTVEDVE